MLAYLRALTLLVAFGIGILGQVAATIAMPMPMQMPQDMAAFGSSTSDSSACPACPKQRDVPGSPAMATCVAAFCSVLPAVLPTGPIVAPLVHTSFPLIAVSGGQGVTIRPDLGPPRPIHNT
jgi:hypothetical protein